MQTGIIYITITCPIVVEKICRKHNAGKHFTPLAELEQPIKSYSMKTQSAQRLWRVQALCVTAKNRALGKRVEKRRKSATKVHPQIFHFSVLPEKVSCIKKKRDNPLRARGMTPRLLVSSVTRAAV